MPVGLFQQPVKNRRPPRLKPATLRQFSGGWNATDDDDLMATHYSVTMNNVQIGTDASINVRPGTFRKTDVSNVVSGNIVNQYYFASHIISVTTGGEVVATDKDGVNTAIWNSTIAATRLGAPSGWSSNFPSVSFVPFKSVLIIHNGVDKPLKVDLDLTVNYLQDEASGSNVNTPIGLYGCVVANYHVVAGIPSSPTAIYITSAGTDSTFPGDPAPNDAISIDVGAYTSNSTQEIRGITGFRSYLLVFFRDSTLIITLGNYTTSSDGTTQTHTPLYNDTLPQVGVQSQRMILKIGNDVIFGWTGGILSANRNLYAGIIQDNTLSDIIAPGYNALSRPLTTTQEIQNTFAVWDPNGLTAYFFMNNTAVAYTFNDKLRVKGWSIATGWNWTCGCTSEQGRVFFSYGTKIYQLGNKVFDGEEVFADFVNDYDVIYTNGLGVTAGKKIYDPVTKRMWSSTIDQILPLTGLMLDLVNANLSIWNEEFGTDIVFDWELPWTDFKVPDMVKHVRTIKIGSKGTAPFTCMAYVDGLYKDEDGNVIHDPALSLDMIGSSSQGFGGSPVQPFGGGRRSQDPLTYKFPVKFKRIKYRITGSVHQPLKINWITAMYLSGSLHRP